MSIEERINNIKDFEYKVIYLAEHQRYQECVDYTREHLKTTPNPEVIKESDKAWIMGSMEEAGVIGLEVNTPTRIEFARLYKELDFDNRVKQLCNVLHSDPEDMVRQVEEAQAVGLFDHVKDGIDTLEESIKEHKQQERLIRRIEEKRRNRKRFMKRVKS